MIIGNHHRAEQGKRRRRPSRKREIHPQPRPRAPKARKRPILWPHPPATRASREAGAAARVDGAAEAPIPAPRGQKAGVTGGIVSCRLGPSRGNAVGNLPKSAKSTRNPALVRRNPGKVAISGPIHPQAALHGKRGRPCGWMGPRTLRGRFSRHARAALRRLCPWRGIPRKLDVPTLRRPDVPHRPRRMRKRETPAPGTSCCKNTVERTRRRCCLYLALSVLNT